MRIVWKSLLLFTLVCFVACGGGGGGGGGTPATVYTASGTWTFDDPSDVLTVTFASSDFPVGCGPEIGTQTFTVAWLTASQMIWDAGMDALLWTRTSVGAGLEGTWTMTTDEGTYDLTVNPGGTFTVTGHDLTCGVSGGGLISFAAGTWTYDDVVDLLTLTVLVRDFPPLCGPDMGPLPATVTSLTPTTMSWADVPPLTWTRTAAGAGLLGGWRSGRDGGTYDLVLNGDATFTLLAEGIDCVPCGSGNYNGSGTWTHDGGTGILAVNFLSSCFPLGCGPEAGPANFLVLSVTPTQMTWDGGTDPDYVWNRAPPGAGLPGTWTMVRDGGNYELTLYDDGYLYLKAEGITCP